MINLGRFQVNLIDQCETNNQKEHFRNAFDSLSLTEYQKKMIWPKMAIWLLNDPVHGFSVIADTSLLFQIENAVLAYGAYLNDGATNEQILRTCAEQLSRIQYPKKKKRDNHIKEGIQGAVTVALNFNQKTFVGVYAESVLYNAIEAEAHIKNPKRRVNGNILCNKYLDLLNEFAEEKQDLLR